MSLSGNDPSPVTLTTSEPLARALRRAHALSQKNAGQAVWEVPAIHGLQRWCRDQWLQTWPSAQLLHGIQELALWQQVIDADTAACNVLSPAALAREARNMGRLVARYLIDPEPASLVTDEHRAFHRWHRSMREALRDRDWVLDCELPTIVAGLVRTGDIPIPARIQIAGPRTLLTPQENSLISTLEQWGCAVQYLPYARNAASTVVALRHDDGRHQFRHLALTLRDLLLAGEEQPEGPPAIVIACPDPTSRRYLIEDCFRPLLAPWLQLPGEGHRPLPWRFANGRTLDQHPLVSAALVICGLRDSGNRLDELSRLLLASAFWDREQRELCAQADYILRDLGGTQYPLRLLARHVPEPLGMRFQSLLDGVRAEPRQALPSDWAQHFEQRLRLLGWPGDRPLGSVAYQAREQWALALATFSAMDSQVSTLSHSAAISWLREIISSRPFEPRTDHDQPIQILGLQDTVGLPCDHLFLVDATDGVLPARPRRYPLLPVNSLAKAGVPDATPAAALETSLRWVSELHTQANTLHLSHARVDDRGAHCQPTPLFGAELVWQDCPAVRHAPSAAERAAENPRLFWPKDDVVPPVQDPSAEGIFGGTGIFKDFVEAPFFAFCKYRLGIKPLPESPAGIPARAQGQIVHAALEQVWRQLRTQENLLASTEEALTEQIEPPLDRALQKYLPTDRFGPVLRQMEHARLRDLILQWLAHEKRRMEPFEVIDCEERVDMVFAGLALRLVIDRVDRIRLRDGGERFLILDYKTGRSAETRGWSADSLTEPQLPLYATSAVLGELGIQRVDGIAFAHLKDGHPALVSAINWGTGLVDEKPRFRMDSWPEQLDAWRDSLNRIAQGFLAGEAGIDLAQGYGFSFNEGLLDLVRQSP